MHEGTTANTNRHAVPVCLNNCRLHTLCSRARLLQAAGSSHMATAGESGNELPSPLIQLFNSHMVRCDGFNLVSIWRIQAQIDPVCSIPDMCYGWGIQQLAVFLPCCFGFLSVNRSHPAGLVLVACVTCV